MMQFTTRYNIGEVIRLRANDNNFVIRNISVYTSNSTSTNIVYEVESPASKQRMIIKESQIDEDKSRICF